MKIKVWIILTLFFVAILLTSCGGGDSGSQPAEQKAPQPETLEYKLASIDKGYRGSRNDIIVTRFRSLLEQLDATYAENKQQIADSTVFAQKMLRDEYGIKESLLNIMEGMNQVFPTKFDPSYKEYVTAYVLLRGTGLPHQQVLIGIEAYLKSIGRR